MSSIEFPGWFCLRGRVYVCAPPKCGSTSLYRAAFRLWPELHNRNVWSTAAKLLEAAGKRFLTASEMGGIDAEKYIAVRSPVSRFKSLWRDKCRGQDPNLPALHGLSMDDLIGYIEQHPTENAHWVPQYTYHCEGAVPVPFRELLTFLGLPPTWVNHTFSKQQDVVSPRDRILAHYAEDQRLFEAL